MPTKKIKSTDSDGRKKKNMDERLAEDMTKALEWGKKTKPEWLQKADDWVETKLFGKPLREKDKRKGR
jgi:hypothetical protein